MKRILLLILMAFMSLNLVSALSIDNTIPTEINQYEFDVNSFASCNDADSCNITFSGDGTTIDLPYSINQNLSYTGDFYNTVGSGFRGITTDGSFIYRVSSTEVVYVDNLDGTYTGTSYSLSSIMDRAEDITYNGSNFFILDSLDDGVYEFDNTFSYTGNFYSLSSQDTVPRGLTYYDDKFYMSGDSTNTVYEYDNTFSTTGFSFSTSSQDGQPWGIAKNENFFYIVGATTDYIFQYNNSGSYTGTSLDISSQTISPQGVVIIENNILVGGDDVTKIYNYTLPINKNINYTFTNNGNQDYTILASNSTNTINETGSLLVNPSVSFNFQDNSTNVENYSFGGRSDTNGFVTYNIYNDGLVIGENTLSFSKFGYVLQNFTFNITQTQSQNFTFNVSEAAINVQIFDRINGGLITQDVDLQLIGNVGNTTTTSTGQATLRAIDGVPGEYQIIATSTGYETESVYFEYTNQENLSVDIYLLNSTDLSVGFVTIEVKDTLSFFIEGAIVNLMEWKPAQSSFITVGQCQTLSNGKCNLNVELNNKLYKFQAIKDGVSSETTSLIIEETGLTFPITLQDITLVSVANSENILANMTQSIDNTTNTSLIRLQWATKDNTNAKACLDVYNSPGFSELLMARNCSISNSGVLFVNVNISQPFNIQVRGTVEDSFNVFTIDSFNYIGTDSLANSLNELNLDIIIPLIFFLLGIGFGLLFGNIYIGVIVGVILEWVAVVIAPNVMNTSMAVAITFLSMLLIWGTYKK